MIKLNKVLGIRFLVLCFFISSITLSPFVTLAQTNQVVSATKGGATDTYQELKIPNLTARVTDTTGTLTPQEIATLENKLAVFETSKGSQVAILMVPSTQPEAIEQFSIRAVEQWKLGRKGVDDGVLLIIAKNDRKMRIEVGRGLEGALPDVYARRIIGDVIAPYFKQEQFFGGINAGLDQILKIISGESLPAPSSQAVNAGYGADANMEGILLMAFMFSLFFGSILKSILGKTFGGIATGGIVGLLAFTMTGLIGIALIATFVGFFASMMGGLGGRGGPIIFPGGGGFGGGFGGGRGGFGGGGGSFGGGGASGDW
jgi:uncharacterized protein